MGRGQGARLEGGRRRGDSAEFRVGMHIFKNQFEEGPTLLDQRNVVFRRRQRLRVHNLVGRRRRDRVRGRRTSCARGENVGEEGRNPSCDGILPFS